MYRRLQGKDFGTLYQGFDEVVVEFMTLCGFQLVSILKAWVFRMIGASNQDLQLLGLVNKPGLQRWRRLQRNRNFCSGMMRAGTSSVRNIHARHAMYLQFSKRQVLLQTGAGFRFCQLENLRATGGKAHLPPA